jgi:hypothetical protein
MRARLQSLLHPSGVVGIAVMASIGVRALTERLADPDLWWHLRTGELIASTRSIPTTDVFSYTAEGRAWTVQEWGSELILHGLREAFGLWGIVAYKVVLLVAIYAVVARIIARHLSSSMGAWALVALTAYAGASNWTERPNLLSFLLFAIVLDLLDRRNARAMWAFVPLCTLWANLHGMVLVGLGLVFVVAVAETMKGASEAAWARHLWRVWALGLLATMLNPRGPGLFVHAFGLLSTVRGVVTEWASPDFHQVGTLPFLLLMVLTFVVLILAARRPDVTDLLLVLAFTYLALNAARNLAIAGIVLGVVVARNARHAARAVWGEREARAGPAPSPVLGVGALIAVAIAFGVVIANRMPASGADADIIEETYPIEAIDRLPEGARVFAYDVWAPMVIDRAWPDARVFFDLRSDMYGIELIADYQHTIAAFPDWRENLDDTCTTHVLIRETDPLSQVLTLSGDWRIERRDERSVTWARGQALADC